MKKRTDDFLSKKDKVKLARLVLLLAINRAKKESSQGNLKKPLTEEQQKRIEAVKSLLSRNAQMRENPLHFKKKEDNGKDLLQ